MSGGSAPTKQAVADIVGSEMARPLTDEAFEDAGVSVDTPSSRELNIIRSRAREPERAVAEEMRSRRSSRARRSAEVLSSFLARCHALLAAQMEIERGDKGGRPSHPEREYVLANLACSRTFSIEPPPRLKPASTCRYHRRCWSCSGSKHRASSPR